MHTSDGTVTLAAWGPDDLPLLERANTPEMMTHLGGPETPEQLVERQERYMNLMRTGEAAMYRIELDGTPVGGIGYWQVDHDGEPAWEAGWNVFSEWQGRGLAHAALGLVVREVADRHDRSLLVAYPGVDNPASNALCRAAGFEHRGSRTEPWHGRELSFNVWVLDMSPLDLDGREPDLDERFGEGVLDEKVWWPHYLPHWSSRERTAARYRIAPDALELFIDADTPPWSPEFDGDNRVSHVQTGQFAGARFVVMICGDIMTMPGLPAAPAANTIDVDDEGRIVGLF